MVAEEVAGTDEKSSGDHTSIAIGDEGPSPAGSACSQQKAESAPVNPLLGPLASYLMAMLLHLARTRAYPGGSYAPEENRGLIRRSVLFGRTLNLTNFFNTSRCP